MSAGDNSINLGAIPKKVTVEKKKEKNLLTLAEIDCRFLKLLRIMGEEDMADYLDLKWRFKDGGVEDAVDYQILTAGIRTSAKSLESEPSPDRRFSQQKKGGKSSFRIEDAEGKNIDGIRRVKDPLVDSEKEQKKDADDWMASGYNRGSMAYQVNQGIDVETVTKDFVLYIVFLVIFNMIAFGVLDHTSNYYATVLSEIITNTSFETSLGVECTFNEIRTVSHIWDFVNELLLPVLYQYGNENTKILQPSMKGKVLMLFENILIGVPRMRQQRVKNDSCSIPSMIRDSFPLCYSYFSEETEDRSPFGLGLPTAWTFTEPNEDSAYYEGRISNYGGGGYMMNITENYEITTEWIAELMQHAWIREGSRAVFIDFTTYTPNTNLFCVVKLVFELPPTGGVIPTSHFYTMKFLRYVNTWDHFILGCEIIFLCFVVYFTMEEVQQMVRLGWRYWIDSWNLLDIAVLTVSYVVAVVSCSRYYTIANNMHLKVKHIEQATHASFDHFVKVQVTYNTAMALLTFLVWLKLLKYAALNKNVAVILSIFSRIRAGLIVLTLMIMYTIFCYALVGNMLFGDHVEQFATIWNSFFSLIGIFVGGLYFYLECAALNPFLAPVYFMTFIFIVPIILLNVYVALMVHGFEKALDDFDDHRERIFMGDIFKMLLYKLFRLFRRDHLAAKLQNDQQAKSYMKEYNDITDIVKKHGYRGLELAMILKKHHIAPGKSVPFDTMSQVYADIDPKSQLYLEVDEHDRMFDQVDKISRRVDVLDKSMADLVVKIDRLVDQLVYGEGA